MSLEEAMRQSDEASTAGHGNERSGTSRRWLGHLNFLNRRMRTRMSGGVGGEES